jgi:murein DD-endopeptidase MepM/ murein hydrolase activator NlpD
MRKLILMLLCLFSGIASAAFPALEYSVPFDLGGYTCTDYVILKIENSSTYDYAVVYYANHQSVYSTTECNKDLSCAQSACYGAFGYASYPDNRGTSGYLLQYNDWCGYIPHFSRKHDKTTGVWSDSGFENQNETLRVDPTLPLSQSTITTFPLSLFNYHPANDDFLGDYGLDVVTFGMVVLEANSPTYLKWPLAGTFASRTVRLAFGTTWTHGQCPSGTSKKHAGIDVNATANEAVYAAHDGVVKAIHYDSLWAYAIVIESNNGSFTTVNWHVNAYGNLAVNNTVTKGQQIATIASLIDPNPPHADNTHFHFGIRMGAYSDPESYAGSLPVADGCGYLAYPESFINPESIVYQ